MARPPRRPSWSLPDLLLALPALVILAVGLLSGWFVLAWSVAGILASLWLVVTLRQIRIAQQDLDRIVRDIQRSLSRPPGPGR